VSLKDKGWRFVLRGASFQWVLVLEAGDIDCTDMSNEILLDLIFSLAPRTFCP
jgi:hypothetical protein